MGPNKRLTRGSRGRGAGRRLLEDRPSVSIEPFASPNDRTIDRCALKKNPSQLIVSLRTNVFCLNESKSGHVDQNEEWSQLFTGVPPPEERAA
jgi:hypothetical protein